MAIGNIGTGNTSTLATFNRCFAFTKLDSGEIPRIKAAAFTATMVFPNENTG